MSAPADCARLEIAAEVNALSVEAATNQAAAALAAMRAALVERGIQAEDLASSNVSVNSYRREREPKKYTARLGLTVTVRDVDSTGALAHAALTAGGDAARLDGLSFGHADASALRQSAREAAFADAAAKAEQFAQLAGQTLGVTEAISEDSGHRGHAVGSVVETASATGLVLDAGKQGVTAAVTVRWAWA